MTGAVLIFIGAVLMIFGTIMLPGDSRGRGRWSGPRAYHDRGATKLNRQWMDLLFLATVVAPMFAGAVLIVLGLLQLH